MIIGPSGLLIRMIICPSGLLILMRNGPSRLLISMINCPRGLLIWIINGPSWLLIRMINGPARLLIQMINGPARLLIRIPTDLWVQDAWTELARVEGSSEAVVQTLVQQATALDNCNQQATELDDCKQQVKELDRQLKEALHQSETREKQHLQDILQYQDKYCKVQSTIFATIKILIFWYLYFWIHEHYCS